jgi:hypothetical protein
VIGGRVEGGVDVVVGGTVVVGACVVGGVVVVGAAVVGGVVVVAAGAEVVLGDVVPDPRDGEVVTTGRAVVAVVGAGAVSPGRVTTVVEEASVLLVDSGTVEMVSGGRKMVTVVEGIVGAWVATCFGVPPEPVATSNSRPSMARDARAYSPTLNR